ncbi:unnamed protein product [Phaeothamnion confervicola]
MEDRAFADDPCSVLTTHLRKISFPQDVFLSRKPSSPMAAEAAKMRALYRQILSCARAFPSRNREGLVLEIRQEFRANATETDPAKLQRQRATALKGLKQLQQYGGFKDSDSNWCLETEKAPLGGHQPEDTAT